MKDLKSMIKVLFVCRQYLPQHRWRNTFSRTWSADTASSISSTLIPQLPAARRSVIRLSRHQAEVKSRYPTCGDHRASIRKAEYDVQIWLSDRMDSMNIRNAMMRFWAIRKEKCRNCLDFTGGQGRILPRIRGIPGILTGHTKMWKKAEAFTGLPAAPIERRQF